MAADLTDLFAAIYERYTEFSGDADPYTYTDGRMHRVQAPSPTKFPCIVVALVGGDVREMFSGDSLDTAILQMSLFAKFKNDVEEASAVMRRLIEIYNRCVLWIPGAETYVSMIREGYQREAIENRTHIHIAQDWAVVRHVPFGGV